MNLNDQDPGDEDSPLDAGATDSSPEADAAKVDMKDNDTLFWVFWPSILYPGKQHMIGWPMRIAPRTYPGD